MSYITNDKKINVYIIDKDYEVSTSYIKKNYGKYVKNYLKEYWPSARYSFLAYLSFIPINILFYYMSKRQLAPKFIKGSKVITSKEYNKKNKNKTYIRLGEIKFPIKYEAMHSFIVGSPGVGKTVAISQMLEDIIRRGDKCIVHDFKGDYVAKFYRPGKDLIFNPLDERSVYWNFFDDIKELYDTDAVGYALIPEAKNSSSDPYWNNAARDVLTGIINYLIKTDDPNMMTYEELYKLCTSNAQDIYNCINSVKGSEAGARSISEPDSKQTLSVLSVMTQYVKIFYYMSDNRKISNKLRIPVSDIAKNKNDALFYEDVFNHIKERIKGSEYLNWDDTIEGEHINWLKRELVESDGFYEINMYIENSLTLKDWLNDPNSGNIYITNYANLQNTLAPILSLMIDLLARRALSMPDDINRRIFLILDEFGQLKKMQSTASIVTQGRSKGLSCNIGIQDMSQINRVYGIDDRKTIINSCGTTLIFKVNDADTANELSQKLGDCIIEEVDVTQSMGVSNNRDGMSLSHKKVKERAVLPSQISNLPNLSQFVQTPDGFIIKNKYTYKNYPNKNESFILRKGLSYEEVIANEKKIKDVDKTVADNLKENIREKEEELGGLSSFINMYGKDIIDDEDDNLYNDDIENI